MILTQISYEEYLVGDLLTWSWVEHDQLLLDIPKDKRVFIVLEDKSFDELVVLFTSGRVVEINSVLREHLILLSRLS